MEKINEIKIEANEKFLLTLAEATEYFGISAHKIRELTCNDVCDFVLWNGNKRMIKRKKFEEYLEKQQSI